MEVLNRSISLHGEKTLLIIDEYHMLSDAQKDKLFGWMEDRLRGYVGEQAKRFFKIELSKLSRYEPINRCKDMNSPIFFVPPGYHAGQEKSASLQVVLVANRIDSRDEERMNERDNSLLLKTRLSGAVLNEKLSSSNITESERKHLQLWFLTSRLVFGEESISCRLVAPILSALRGHKQSWDLQQILMAKLPTISLVSAEQFVSAFLASLEGSSSVGSPFGLLFKVAALERDHDGDQNSACSYPDFMTMLPRDINLAPPAVRLMCWVAYVVHLRTRENQEEIVFWLDFANIFSSRLSIPGMVRP